MEQPKTNPVEKIIPEAVIEELLNLEPVTDQDKADILVVARGLKPAARVELLFKEGAKDYTNINFANDVLSLDQVLTALNLPHNNTVTEDEKSGFTHAVFVIGKDGHALNDLKQANATHDDEKIGAALGIPESARDAKIKKQTMKESVLRLLVHNDTLLNFAWFDLSTDHWEEELIEIEKRANTIKGISPALYIKIANKKRK